MEHSKNFSPTRLDAIERNLVKNTDFLKLSDKLLFIMTELTANEMKLLLVLIRIMVGRGQNTKSIAMIDLCALSGITQKQNLSRAKKTLLNRGLIKFKRVGLYDEYFVLPRLLKLSGKRWELAIEYQEASQAFKDFKCNQKDYDRNQIEHSSNQIDYGSNQNDYDSNQIEHDSNQKDALTKKLESRDFKEARPSGEKKGVRDVTFTL